ncbi:MAG TPA: methyl-accepting chemotaxis protein [Clostridia bacterium]|nr:methyl-accepting chemotaxis protein [Clostridia bacterium]
MKNYKYTKLNSFLSSMLARARRIKLPFRMRKSIKLNGFLSSVLARARMIKWPFGMRKAGKQKAPFTKWHFTLSDISIRDKIIATVVIAVLIPMAVSTYISGSMVAGRIEESEKERLFDTLDSSISYIEDYRKKARDNASILSNAAELRLYCTNGNNIGASQFLVQLASEIGMDFAMVADKDKRLLTRTDQPLKAGDDLSEDYMIKSGFAGFKNVNIYPSAAGIAIQAVSPVKSSTAATGVQTVGAIVTQYNIDRRFVENIKKTNGTEATIYVNDIIISTLAEEKAPDKGSIEKELGISSAMKEKLLDPKTRQIEKRNIGGRLYYVAYKPVLNSRSESVGILSIAVPQDEAALAKRKVQLYIFMIGLAGIVFAVLFAVFTSKSIAKPINRLVLDTKVIAEGNLRYKSGISGKDEIGQLAEEFNEMADSLRKLVNQVLQTVAAASGSSEALNSFIKDVNEITVEVEAISEKVKQGSQEQYEYLGQTRSEMDHVSAGAAEISGRTLEIAGQANTARQVVEKEAGSLRDLSDNMDITKATIMNMTGRIGDFKLNLQQIGKAAEIVTSIAARTKLLALNAAIEAARAGDAGRGFGVVAQEIRKLSDESGNSIVTVKEIIKALFAEMDATIDVVRNSADNFEQCIAISKGAERSFEEIVVTFKEIDGSISDISAKADMQALNINKVSSLISDVESIAQRAQEQSELMHEGAISQSSFLGELIRELERLKDDIEKTNSVVMNFKV